MISDDVFDGLSKVDETSLYWQLGNSFDLAVRASRGIEKQTKSMNKKMLWIIYPFCSIFIITGAAIAFSAIRGIVRANTIESWPTVDAHITQCEFKTHEDSDSNSYEVIVRYDYTVLGKQYSNTKIHPTYTASSFDGHKQLYERLKKCSIVRARYNELSPEESYIVTGKFSSALSLLFVGMLFFSVGIFFMLCLHFALAGNSNFAAGLDVVHP